jgi:hypothetical protein
MRRTIITIWARRIRGAFVKLFGNPSARVIAEQELIDAKRYLLLNQSAAEYHTQMNVFYQNTITRLEKYLKEDT